MGRRKAHHTHEINDAYAEGWDARMLWRLGRPLPANPYVIKPVVGALLAKKKQSVGKRTTRCRDAEQWQQGWDACHSDIYRGDLVEVAPVDFRPVNIDRLLPEVEPGPDPDFDEELEVQ